MIKLAAYPNFALLSHSSPSLGPLSLWSVVTCYPVTLGKCDIRVITVYLPLFSHRYPFTPQTEREKDQLKRHCADCPGSESNPRQDSRRTAHPAADLSL